MCSKSSPLVRQRAIHQCQISCLEANSIGASTRSQPCPNVSRQFILFCRLYSFSQLLECKYFPASFYGTIEQSDCTSFWNDFLFAILFRRIS